MRDTIATALILAAPASLVAGIIHTAAYNSPGILLGVAAAIICGILANILAN